MFEKWGQYTEGSHVVENLGMNNIVKMQEEKEVVIIGYYFWLFTIPAKTCLCCITLRNLGIGHLLTKIKLIIPNFKSFTIIRIYLHF